MTANVIKDLFVGQKQNCRTFIRWAGLGWNPDGVSIEDVAGSHSLLTHAPVGAYNASAPDSSLEDEIFHTDRNSS